jgi:hypothetical protein
VGQVAKINNRFHGVQGIAMIVDDCTIVISKFSFDADLSLETRIILGQANSFQTGVSASGNLVKSGPYKNDVLVLMVRLNRYSAEAIPCISVWCTQAWIDFGSGCFQDPSDSTNNLLFDSPTPSPFVGIIAPDDKNR